MTDNNKTWYATDALNVVVKASNTFEKKLRNYATELDEHPDATTNKDRVEACLETLDAAFKTIR